MSFKPNYKNKSPAQYPSDEKGAYYRSADLNSDHPLSKIDYCIDFIERTCPKGDSCKKRHIFYAQLRRELKCIQPPYKKHLCQIYEQTKKCSKSKYLCLFAHGESDIWNSKYQESKADAINKSDVDERRKNSQKQRPQGDKQPQLKQQQQVQGNQKEDIIQQILQMKKQEQQAKTKARGEERKKNENVEKKPKKEKVEQKDFQQQQNKVSSRNNRREKSNQQPQSQQQQQQQTLRVANNLRNQEVTQSTVQKRNNQRTNKPAANPDAMTDQEFEQYLLQIKEEMLMNEQGEEKDLEDLEDDDDEEDQNEGSDEGDNDEDFDDDEQEIEQKDYDYSSNSSDKENDLFIKENTQNKKVSKKQSDPTNKKDKSNGKKGSKNDEESWESEDEDDEDEEKEKKDSMKQNKKSKESQQTNFFQDFKNIDWKKVDPKQMTNQQLMSLHAAILHNEPDSQEEEESDENNLSKEYNQLDEQKLNEEREKRKLERAEQRKRKKEEKKQQRQQERDKKFNQNQIGQPFKNSPLANQSNQNNNIIPAQNKDSLFQFDQLEIFCFCYFNTESDLKNWKETLLEIFFELQIPRNALIITEEDRCEGEFGILIKLKSLRVVCLQLLRINLYKTAKLKILFKIVANPDSQISFSKQVRAAKRLNDHSFQGLDGQTYILYNSTIEHSESESLEFKNYDFRNYNENTRKLEEVITGMLNREEFENEEFYKKQEISGKIYLGVKDATRQFVGCCTTNNHHESFFTFLAKRLRDCQPAIKNNLYSREECRLVIPGENENEFFPILDMKVFIITVNKPEINTIYATSSSLYFQKIEEGNWPMSACSLYEKKQKNYISEEKLKLALKQLDRRYFYVMAKMANQNALIQSDYNNIEQSQY